VHEALVANENGDQKFLQIILDYAPFIDLTDADARALAVRAGLIPRTLANRIGFLARKLVAKATKLSRIDQEVFRVLPAKHGNWGQRRWHLPCGNLLVCDQPLVWRSLSRFLAWHVGPTLR
jgi:hypothetical protein